MLPKDKLGQEEVSFMFWGVSSSSCFPTLLEFFFVYSLKFNSSLKVHVFVNEGVY